MAEFSYGANGEVIVHSRYSRTGVLNLTSIFPDDKTTSKLVAKTAKQNLEKLYKVDDLPQLTRKIFFTFIMKVLSRVADGDTFVFPGTTGAYITLKKMSDANVRLVRQLGKYVNIDILKSGFNIPEFIFDFGPKYTRKDRKLYVTKELESKAFRNAENGLLPWTEFRKVQRYDNKLE